MQVKSLSKKKNDYQLCGRSLQSLQKKKVMEDRRKQMQHKYTYTKWNTLRIDVVTASGRY